MNPPIPAPDVLPLPAPAGLIQFLLVLTFILHLVPMNFLLGGGILAGMSHLLSKKHERHARLAKRLSELMPTAVAMAVSLGVAPLLFVQVLYGHLLYSSSILMAYAWFLVVPLVIIGYYGVYLLRFKWDHLGRFRIYVAWFLAIVFAGVGFIYSNNFSLMQRPETWKDHYFASPDTGHLALSDPALYPRYLHMLLGAVAVAGVWVLIIGARRRSGDEEWSHWAMRYGGRVFTFATLLNIVVGFWFMISVPRRAMMIFHGEELAGHSSLRGFLHIDHGSLTFTRTGLAPTGVPFRVYWRWNTRCRSRLDGRDATRDEDGLFGALFQFGPTPGATSVGGVCFLCSDASNWVGNRWVVGPSRSHRQEGGRIGPSFLLSPDFLPCASAMSSWTETAEVHQSNLESNPVGCSGLCRGRIRTCLS